MPRKAEAHSRMFSVPRCCAWQVQTGMPRGAAALRTLLRRAHTRGHLLQPLLRHAGRVAVVRARVPHILDHVDLAAMHEALPPRHCLAAACAARRQRQQRPHVALRVPTQIRDLAAHVAVICFE
eukprot:363634-Chlamydomonas_euryale.AAC.7